MYGDAAKDDHGVGPEDVGGQVAREVVSEFEMRVRRRRRERLEGQRAGVTWDDFEEPPEGVTSEEWARAAEGRAAVVLAALKVNVGALVAAAGSASAGAGGGQQAPEAPAAASGEAGAEAEAGRLSGGGGAAAPAASAGVRSAEQLAAVADADLTSLGGRLWTVQMSPRVRLPRQPAGNSLCILCVEKPSCSARNTPAFSILALRLSAAMMLAGEGGLSWPRSAAAAVCPERAASACGGRLARSALREDRAARVRLQDRHQQARRGAAAALDTWRCARVVC